MEELMIYKYQCKEIEDALRLAMNILESRTGQTALDRQLIRADKMIKAVMEGNKNPNGITPA